MIAPTLKVNTANWSAGFNILRASSKSLPLESLATSVAFIVEHSMEDTFKMSMGAIDSKMSAITTTRLIAVKGPKKGQPLKKPARKVALENNSNAERIILSRMWPGSQANFVTDGRYAIDRADFSPGKGVRGFWAEVKKRALRMVKSRHSSIGFFQRSWRPLLGYLATMVKAQYTRKFTRAAGRIDPSLGNAFMRGAGTNNTTLTIQNALGMKPEYPNISQRRNTSAHILLTKALQDNIDKEFASQMAVAMKRGLLDREPQLRLLGFRVK